MPVGTLLAAGGVALSGQFDGYLATGGALVVSSIGVAMYHPEAVRFASYVSLAAGRQGTGMSMFAVGGLSGWALGPILTTPVVAIFGLHGTPIVALVPLAATALLLRQRALPRDLPADGRVRARGARDAWPPSDWPGFTVAATAGTLRTGALFGFQAFVPLYVWRTLESSEGVGNIAIAAMLAAGALGTLLGGRMSDLHGFRRVVVYSLFASAPLALLVPVVPLLALFPVLTLFGLISEMNFYPDRRARPARAAAPRGLRLGRHAGAQHRPRLAREPAARRARRRHLAAHGARRGRAADGARRARLARAAARGGVSAAFDDVLEAGRGDDGRARLREPASRPGRRSSRTSPATSTRACSRRSSASGSRGSTATRPTSGRPRSAASTSASRRARRAASRSRSRCPCWRPCASASSARALYIYPTKALAQDQARALREYGLGLQAGGLRRRHARASSAISCAASPTRSSRTPTCSTSACCRTTAAGRTCSRTSRTWSSTRRTPTAASSARTSRSCCAGCGACARSTAASRSSCSRARRSPTPPRPARRSPASTCASSTTTARRARPGASRSGTRRCWTRPRARADRRSARRPGCWPR